MPYLKRKIYTPQFKFDRALEAIKADSLSQIARQYDIGANLVSKWKGLLLKHGAHIFESNPDKQTENLKNKLAKLEQMIGQKEIELNLLKNFSDFYSSPSISS